MAVSEDLYYIVIITLLKITIIIMVMITTA
jgi:hypothetical protein